MSLQDSHRNPAPEEQFQGILWSAISEMPSATLEAFFLLAASNGVSSEQLGEVLGDCTVAQRLVDHPAVAPLCIFEEGQWKLIDSLREVLCWEIWLQDERIKIHDTWYKYYERRAEPMCQLRAIYHGLISRPASATFLVVERLRSWEATLQGRFIEQTFYAIAPLEARLVDQVALMGIKFASACYRKYRGGFAKAVAEFELFATEPLVSELHGHAWVAVAECYEAMGSPESALDAFKRAFKLLTDSDYLGESALAGLGAAETASISGNTTAALKWFQTALAAATKFGSLLAQGQALLGLATLGSDRAAAGIAFRDSVAKFDECGDRLLASRARLLWAKGVVGGSALPPEDGSAQDLLSRCASAFTELGFDSGLKEVDSVLDDLLTSHQDDTTTVRQIMLSDSAYLVESATRLLRAKQKARVEYLASHERRLNALREMLVVYSENSRISKERTFWLMTEILSGLAGIRTSESEVLILFRTLLKFGSSMLSPSGRACILEVLCTESIRLGLWDWANRYAEDLADMERSASANLVLALTRRQQRDSDDGLKDAEKKVRRLLHRLRDGQTWEWNVHSCACLWRAYGLLHMDQAGMERKAIDPLRRAIIGFMSIHDVGALTQTWALLDAAARAIGDEVVAADARAQVEALSQTFRVPDGEIVCEPVY